MSIGLTRWREKPAAVLCFRSVSILIPLSDAKRSGLGTLLIGSVGILMDVRASNFASRIRRPP